MELYSLPGAECPVIPLHDVGELRRFLTAEGVSEITFRVKYIAVGGLSVCYLDVWNRKNISRIRIPLLIVVKSVAIKNHKQISKETSLTSGVSPSSGKT
jgi:hypothetical protein